MHVSSRYCTRVITANGIKLYLTIDQRLYAGVPHLINLLQMRFYLIIYKKNGIQCVRQHSHAQHSTVSACVSLILPMSRRMENGWSYLTYLKPVVCPRSPLHSTMLHVEWKLFYVDVTYGHVNSVTEPCDLTGVLHYHVSVNNRRTIIRICTKINLKE